MTEESRYIPLKLELDYAYSLGDLKPYFDALRQGRALASRCPECGRTSFPPRLVCNVDRFPATWQELTGCGSIQQLSAGRNATFAQIAMDGADNQCLGRLEGSDFRKGDRVRLDAVKAVETAHPASCAVFRRIS